MSAQAIVRARMRTCPFCRRRAPEGQKCCSARYIVMHEFSGRRQGRKNPHCAIAKIKSRAERLEIRRKLRRAA